MTCASASDVLGRIEITAKRGVADVVCSCAPAIPHTNAIATTNLATLQGCAARTGFPFVASPLPASPTT